MKIAQIMLYSVAGAVCLIALMWLLTPKLLQFQEDFIGLTHEELAPEVASLYLALYKTIGAGILAIGVGLALLTRGPVRRGDPWGRWIILTMTVIWGLPYAWGAFQIGSPTFVVPLALTLTVIIAVFITRQSS